MISFFFNMMHSGEDPSTREKTWLLPHSRHSCLIVKLLTVKYVLQIMHNTHTHTFIDIIYHKHVKLLLKASPEAATCSAACPRQLSAQAPSLAVCPSTKFDEHQVWWAPRRCEHLSKIRTYHKLNTTCQVSYTNNMHNTQHNNYITQSSSLSSSWVSCHRPWNVQSRIPIYIYIYIHTIFI